MKSKNLINKIQSFKTVNPKREEEGEEVTIIEETIIVTITIMIAAIIIILREENIHKANKKLKYKWE